jgi:hypothetical protein
MNATRPAAPSASTRTILFSALPPQSPLSELAVLIHYLGPTCAHKGVTLDRHILPLLAAAPDLLAACRAPELDSAHDCLSNLLEDPAAGSDEIRASAIALCIALSSHSTARHHAIGKAGWKKTPP